MGNGFQFIDIIFFAMIAAFLVLRLRSVLGRRDGHEGGYSDPFKRDNVEDGANGANGENDNVVQLPDRGEDDDSRFADGADVDAIALQDDLTHDLGAGYAQVRRADPSFDSEEFLVGARVAFEMILNAYASGDAETLKPLLSNDVYANFLKVIQDREQAGHVMEDTLVGISSSEMVEVYMEGRIAHITIKFITDQINIIRDENGDIVDGNPNEVLTVTDFWTFARDARSGDPNWVLVATRSLD